MHPIPYRPDIDGLRAIAVLSVLAFHAFPEAAPGGFTGVDVFFVISGYLISSILLRDFEQGAFTYRTFYKKRILRLFPALLLMLAACLLFGWRFLFAEELGQLGKHVVAGAGFLSNFVLWSESGYFDNVADTKPLLHLWSLGVEEQFYIFWPLFLGVFRRHGRRLLPLLVGLVLLSFCANVLVVGFDPVTAFYSPVTRLWELLLGSILAHLSLHRPEVLKRAPPFQAAAGLLLILLGFLLTNRTHRFPGWWALLPAVGAFAFISAGPGAYLNRAIIGSPPLVWVGRISYPLYLWHWPLFSFAYVLNDGPPAPAVTWGLLVLSIALAWLTYRFVESPLRSHASGGRVAVALGVLMLCLGLAGFAVFQGEGWRSRAIDQTAALIDTHKQRDRAIRARYALGSCEGALAAPGDVDPFCQTYNPEAPGKLLFVWGDSHAEAWGPLFFQLAQEQGLRVVIVSHRGCPSLVGVRRSDGIDTGEDCATADRADSVVRYIARLQPDAVVLASFWSLYAHGWVVKGVLQKSTHFLTVSPDGDATLETSREALVRQLPVTVDRILETGSRVVVFKGPPLLKSNLSKRNYLRRTEIEVSRAEHLRFEQLIALVVERLATERGIAVFDPAPRLCEGEGCQSVLGEVPMYSDDNHITEQGTLLFKGDVAQVLAPLLSSGAPPRSSLSE
ncbi:acyltransferase family protein [Myxococcaceae bacterium GXIMD 01537]